MHNPRKDFAMFQKTLTKTLIAASLCGLTLCAQPALAQSAASLSDATLSAQRLVHFADLDLATPAGQAQLDSRLRRAANAVCESNLGPRTLNEAMESRRCYRSALKSAHRDLASIANRTMASR
jgi:UrcA family protein